MLVKKISIIIFFPNNFLTKKQTYKKNSFHKNLFTKKILRYGYYLNAKKYLKRDKCGQTRIKLWWGQTKMFWRGCFVRLVVLLLSILFMILTLSLMFKFCLGNVICLMWCCSWWKLSLSGWWWVCKPIFMSNPTQLS